jgi:hypothetical protein
VHLVRGNNADTIVKTQANTCQRCLISESSYNIYSTDTHQAHQRKLCPRLVQCGAPPMLWSYAILLYSPTRCCASTNASQGCARERGSSSIAGQLQVVRVDGSSCSVHLNHLCSPYRLRSQIAHAKSGNPRKYRSHSGQVRTSVE